MLIKILAICLIVYLDVEFVSRKKSEKENWRFYSKSNKRGILLSELFEGNKGAGNGFSVLVMSFIISKYSKRCIYSIFKYKNSHG